MAAAPQADDVQPDDAAALPVEQHERRNILDDAGMPAHHGEAANAAELVHRDGPRDKGTIRHRHVTTEHRSIGEDGVVADRAVVAEMPAGHDVIAAADCCRVLRLERPMDRDIFAENVVVADHDPPDVLGTAGMLWGPADDGMLAEFVVHARLHARLQDNARRDHAVVAEFNVGLHAGKGPDAHTDAQPGLGTHVCQRMNAHGVFHAGLGPPLPRSGQREVSTKATYRLMRMVDSMSV